MTDKGAAVPQKWELSLKGLVKRFWKRTVLTWILVLCEGAVILLMPLAIGMAVDDLINTRWAGILQLVSLCFLLLIIGAARRLYDTRIYAGIYKIVGNELVRQGKASNISISKISAWTNLFNEFIEFLENSIPDLVHQSIGFIGTLFIIAFMHVGVFWACLASAVLTLSVYILGEKRIFRLTKGLNDEFEKQVGIFLTGRHGHVKQHFRKLMVWNIKLSDFETFNFAVIWIGLSASLVYSTVAASASGTATPGQVLAVMMYVFGFMENVMSFPVYFQQLIRLNDISQRIRRSISSANGSNETR